jgi:hypothetical protein
MVCPNAKILFANYANAAMEHFEAQTIYENVKILWTFCEFAPITSTTSPS